MAALLEPPRPRPLSGWSATRYPGPSAEERGYRLQVTISVEEPSEIDPPAAAPIEPPPPAVAELPAPVPAAPVTPRPDAKGLYDLRQLLGRIWSIPDASTPPTTSPSPAPLEPHHPEEVVRSPEPDPPSAPEDRGPSDFALLSVIPDREEPHEIRPAPVEPPGTIPRWVSSRPAGSVVTRHRAQAWICVSCRLINAPWSVLCTRCRNAAPSN